MIRPLWELRCLFARRKWHGKVMMLETELGLSRVPDSAVYPFLWRWSTRRFDTTFDRNQVDEYARLAREALAACFEDMSVPTAR